MEPKDLSRDALFWALQGSCAPRRKPFSRELGHPQVAAPHTVDSLIRAARAYGFDATLGKCKVDELYKESVPLVAWLTPKASAIPASAGAAVQRHAVTPALLLQADSANVLVVARGDTAPLRFPSVNSARVTAAESPASDLLSPVQKAVKEAARER
jgi:subfamily B ATP-binding cassette protein HlyB/CyaB